MIHLWSHNEKDIEIQLYIYLITYLQRHFKQSLTQEQIEAIALNNKPENEIQEPTPPERHSDSINSP